MEYEKGGEKQVLSMYSVNELGKKEERTPYGGYGFQEILDSGKDLLGEIALKNGEPSYDEVKKLLPEILNVAYTFISGSASWGGIMIDNRGYMYPQELGAMKPMPLLSPVEVDGEVGKNWPSQYLVGKRLPVVLSVHHDEENVVEIMCFVEPGDPDRNPIMWTRIKRYKRDNPEGYTLSYKIIALSRFVQRREISEETFYEALLDTVQYWLNFEKRGAEILLPQKELETVTKGAQIFMSTTFSGDHAHYGHQRYGWEVHDNFPPNYLWSLECMIVMGRLDFAKGIFNHLMNYSITDEGRFTYRQGDDEIHGASAEEYCQLLFLINRYKNQLGFKDFSESIIEKLIGMGELILSNCKKADEFGGRVLVYMCAEADTNTRINAYLNNNLWAIRGLSSLNELISSLGIKDDRFKNMSETLKVNVDAIIKEETQDTKFGKLPPFRFGYTPTPLNLSVCYDSFYPATKEELDDYSKERNTRGEEFSQDFNENTYANYRYYPEMLSTMYLDEEQEKAIVKMREALGGEILGMTRFRGWLDDWPVLHYARFLIEREYIDKYLLLLYAHTNHHGRPDLMSYYEQVSITNGVVAPDCVPSLLTTPVMTAWMFLYETMASNEIRLLSGVPKDWFEKGAEVKKLYCSEGFVSIRLKDNRCEIEVSGDFDKDIVLYWRAKDKVLMEDIKAGAENVEKIENNKITLKKGLYKFILEVY